MNHVRFKISFEYFKTDGTTETVETETNALVKTAQWYAIRHGTGWVPKQTLYRSKKPIKVKGKFPITGLHYSTEQITGFNIVIERLPPKLPLEF